MADQIFQVNCGFFDSVNKDRLYTADEMNKPYKRLISNGVFATPNETPSTDLQVLSQNNAMNIIVKKGEGLFADKWFENPTDLVITVPANTNIVSRIDSVIVQVDKRTDGRTGNIVYREGAPNSDPTPPAIGTVTNVIEYRIANILVAAGVNNIGQDSITDLRGSSECPWVTSLIKQVDTSTLYAQWQSAYQNYYNSTEQKFDDYYTTATEEFETWFNHLQNTASTLAPIRAFTYVYTTSSDESVIPINISEYNKELDILNVYINGFRLIVGQDYVIDSNTQITLTLPVYSGTSVAFEVLKSMDGNGAI